MTISTLRLLRFELNVSDLAHAVHFYTGALDFSLGEANAQQAVLHRHGATLVLRLPATPGRPYPPGAAACDQVFQHFALPVADMQAAYQRLSAFAPAPISTAGPQHLPQRSGGATAYKFRDPDGHPLELIQFPDRHNDGIDHSAIVSTDTDRSIAFYRGQLGLAVAARQINTGVEQDRLDGLQSARVEVVALTPETEAPHIELLGYTAPPPRPAGVIGPDDIAATKLVLAVTGLGDGPRTMQDPDGHWLVLVETR